MAVSMYVLPITTKKKQTETTHTKQRKKTSNKIQKTFRLQHLKLDHTLLISKKIVNCEGEIIFKNIYIFLLV